MRFLTAFWATLSRSAVAAVYAQAVAPIVASDHATTPTKFTSALPTGDLPDSATFKAQNGTKWKIEYVGDLQFSGTLGTKGLGGDKCRSSVLGDRVIWNCGDMQCAGDWRVCGFSMGPAFYGTNSVMVVNTTSVALVQDNDFATVWPGDPAPQAPQTAWGMDTSNVAPINDTHGIAYAWEIWRGAPDGSFVDRGNAVVAVTLGETKPIATRVGPLLSGPDAMQMGHLAILRDGDYIYSYSMGGPSGIMVSRVAASDDALDAAKYEFLVARRSDSPTWKTPGTVPAPTSTEYGMQTANADGTFGCNVYGSVFYSNYLRKYVIICTAYMHFTNIYVADQPWGPWSAEYGLLEGWGAGYGSHAHPEYSPGGSHKEVYFSQGPNGPFNIFKVTFDF
ncbi:hypothetical protein DIS24_g7232 [Lasiodiplodia hormozganensis]|uniref:DUF4185 domain-containing protein n=1 Tax=Lasiodiplodia hormozganensis TaxID=869390 RepID=A0AA39Y8E0_9PEZI|nr:hypothetical protein DIS24_g7232 [Lasiodiplodia hormozganensis]